MKQPVNAEDHRKKRNRRIFRMARHIQLTDIAEEMGLSLSYVTQLVQRNNRWGEFA